MSASTSTSAPLEQSTESIQLTSSASLQSSGSVTAEEKVAPAPEKLPPQIVTPNLDSREAFLQFCRQYAPYMEYPALFAKEVRVWRQKLRDKVLDLYFPDFYSSWISLATNALA
jgi:hypothetical protein